MPLPEGYTSQVTISSARAEGADAPGAPGLSLAEVRLPGLSVLALGGDARARQPR